MPRLEEILKESILDPLQETLSSELWEENEKLKKTVKTHIIKRLEGWLKGKTSKTIKKMFILGSMTGYQYTPSSDIDVNFIIDVTDDEIKEIGKAMMTELNEKNLFGTQHPVNYFVVNKPVTGWENQSVYDVLKDSWIRKPKKEDQVSVIGNFRAVTEISRFFTAGVDLMISEYHSDVAAYENYSEYYKKLTIEKDKEDLKILISIKLQEIIADIDGVYIAKHMLRALRVEAFDKEEGLEINTKIDIKDNLNNSINNLVYKYVEKLGYFPRIKEILDQSDAWNSKIKEEIK